METNYYGGSVGTRLKDQQQDWTAGVAFYDISNAAQPALTNTGAGVTEEAPVVCRQTVQSRATWPDMSAWVMPSGCPAGHWTSSMR